MAATDDEARAFAATFRAFLEWVHEQRPPSERDNEVVRLVRDWLGPEGLRHSVVRRDLAPFEHANLQVALDAWAEQDGRDVDLRGLAQPQHYGPLSLQMLLHGTGCRRCRLSAPDLVDLPTGPDRTLACLRSGLLLVDDARGRSVLLVSGLTRAGRGAVARGRRPADAEAQALLRELDELRSRLNVYRGQLLELEAGRGGVQVRFPRLPPPRATTSCCRGRAAPVERHSLDMAARASSCARRAAPQARPAALRPARHRQDAHRPLPRAGLRGHDGAAPVRAGRCTSSGRHVPGPRPAAGRAGARGRRPGRRGPRPTARARRPVLFELLDAMDGAAEDADLLFLLTDQPRRPARAGSGRPPRPGRRRGGDRSAGRRRHARGCWTSTRASVPLELSDGTAATVVERMEGVTASFVKELLRRAVLRRSPRRPVPCRR
jgi:hypothetical protein